MLSFLLLTLSYCQTFGINYRNVKKGWNGKIWAVHTGPPFSSFLPSHPGPVHRLLKLRPMQEHNYRLWRHSYVIIVKSPSQVPKFHTCVKFHDHQSINNANKSFEIKMSKWPNLLTFVPYLDNNKDQSRLNQPPWTWRHRKSMMGFILSLKLVGHTYPVKLRKSFTETVPQKGCIFSFIQLVVIWTITICRSYPMHASLCIIYQTKPIVKTKQNILICDCFKLLSSLFS